MNLIDKLLCVDKAKAEEKETKQEVVKVVEDFERTKQFQFTLQPSVREKINRLAKENGYRSASSFLNDYFKNL